MSRQDWNEEPHVRGQVKNNYTRQLFVVNVILKQTNNIMGHHCIEEVIQGERIQKE